GFEAADAATDLRTVFSWSYRALRPDVARLFRLLGLHPGPDVSLAAAASIAATPRPKLRLLLAELARANLIHEHRAGRYAFHDLLRAYAGELAHAGDDDERSAATRRMLDHYLHTGFVADRIIQPARELITLLPPQPGVDPEDLP